MVKITIQEIERAIKEVMAGSEIQYSDSVYEEKDGILRLIIFFNKLFTEKEVVIYTKLMFNVDENKIYVLPNKSGQYFFKYLYDINCHYEMKIFDDIQDFKSQWDSIIKTNKFGENLKILSEFIKHPAFAIDEWLQKNEVSDVSVTGVKYDPRVKIMPCKSLSFHFVMTINNSEDVELSIKKEGKNDYILTFQINGENIEKESEHLTNLVQIIGDTLKEKFSK